MAILTTQTISPSGTSPTYQAAAVGGDKVRPNERTFIHVRNGGGASITVTVDDALSQAPSGAKEFDADLSVVIEPSGNRMIGPLPPARFRGTDGYASVTYTGVTSVTIAALRA